MKYLRYLIYTLLLTMTVAACDLFTENTDKFPLDISKITDPENTGTFVRVIEKEGNVWNLFDITNQEYTVTLEVDDAEDGGQLGSLDFTVGFDDNAAGVIGDLPQSDVIRTIQADEFEVNQQSGLPRVTTTFSAGEFIDALGVDPADLGINASFTLRWTVHTTTGKSFNNQNSGFNITGGAFYNSPFAENITLSLQIPEDQFVGDYAVEQTSGSGGITVGFDDGWFFGDPGNIPVYSLKVDPNNTLNGRIFTTDEYLDDLGGFTLDLSFSLTFNPLTNREIAPLNPNIPLGAGCAEGIFFGPPENPGDTGTWDPDDDSQFTLTVIEDITNDCGFGPGTYTFTFTKQ